jgi:hypothetical protein
MEELCIGNYRIAFDRERTRHAYASIENGGADDCGCSYCKNFTEQRLAVYPPAFLELLDQLGIDSKKEDEVYECGSSGRLRDYGGWFYFVGVLNQSRDAHEVIPNSGFSYYFVDAARRPNSREHFGDQVLALEFNFKIPWVLDCEP